jgi:spore germination cell wall hydrolase CwlJ-like protein
MIRIIKFFVYSLALLAVSILGYSTVTHKLTVLKEAHAQVSPVTAEMRQKQLDCLARNIYHEAGGEPFEGKVAVAQVTINRTENGAFPSDICQVVYQKNIVYEN